MEKSRTHHENILGDRARYHGYLVKISARSDGNFASYSRLRENLPCSAGGLKSTRQRGGMDVETKRYTCPITVEAEIGQRGTDLGLSYKYGCERRLNDHSYSFRPKSFLGKSRHSDFQL